MATQPASGAPVPAGHDTVARPALASLSGNSAKLNSAPLNRPKPAIKPLAAATAGTSSDPGDGKKRARDEQIEALVRGRDAAVQKARAAEQECARWKQSAESATTLQLELDTLRNTVRTLEAQQFEARNYAMSMARATHTMELERERLERDLCALALRKPAHELQSHVDALEAHNAQLREQCQTAEARFASERGAANIELADGAQRELALREANAQLCGDLEALRGANACLRQDSMSMAGALDAMRVERDQSQNDARLRLGEMTVALDAARLENAQLKQQYAQLQRDNEQMRVLASTADALREDNDKLRACADEMRLQADAAEVLMGAIEMLKDEKAQLRAANGALAAQAEALTASARTLQRDNARLRGEAAHLRVAMSEQRAAFEDKIDAEAVLNQGLQQECNTLRGAMGSGLDDLRVKLETGLQLALGRVDHMETLLWQERGKSAKFLGLLKQLVDEEDLEVLLSDEEAAAAAAAAGNKDADSDLAVVGASEFDGAPEADGAVETMDVDDNDAGEPVSDDAGDDDVDGNDSDSDADNANDP